MTKKKSSKKVSKVGKIQDADIVDEEFHEMMSHHFHTLKDSDLSEFNKGRQAHEKMKGEDVFVLVIGNHEEEVLVQKKDAQVLDMVLGVVWEFLKKEDVKTEKSEK